MSRRAQTGFTATLIFLALGWGISLLTSIQRQKEIGTPYHIIFNRVEGLEEGCKVFYAGRLVGRVRRMEVFRQPDEPDRVDVTVSISPFYTSSVKLTRESNCSVEGGIWGERWININYEPGPPIPPNGTVNGISVPRLAHLLRHGVSLIDELEEIVKGYNAKLGDVNVTGKKLKKAVQYYNDTAFEMRVQANRFNKFAGLINDRMDAMVKTFEHRVAAAHNRSAIMSAQMRMYARGLQGMAARKDDSLHAMLIALSRRIGGAATPLRAFEKTILSFQAPMRASVSNARKKVKDLRDIAQTLRLISHNPRLKEQFRQMSGDLRTRVHAMRQMLKNRGGATATPGHAPSGAPEASPSPVSQPLPAPVTAPVMPSPPPFDPSAPTGGSPPRPPRAPTPSPTPEGR